MILFPAVGALPDDHLDDGGVPLLVPTHAPRTEGLGQPGDMVILLVLLVLHVQAGDDDVETVAVARGHVSNVQPSLHGCGVGGVEVDDAGVGTDTLTPHIIVVTSGQTELGEEDTHRHHQPHHLPHTD